MEQTTSLMTASQVARRLTISAERVRQLAREGRLKPIQTTELGRLWNPADVERFAETRDQWGRYSRAGVATQAGDSNARAAVSSPCNRSR
jgi:predicted site-specific integrase-resolvase